MKLEIADPQPDNGRQHSRDSNISRTEHNVRLIDWGCNLSDSSALYAELRPDIEALAAPLFEVSEGLLRRQAAFLPHGAVLDANGGARMVMAAPPGFEDHPVSTDVLPLLYEALRAKKRDGTIRAIAVCEDVTITPEGGRKTAAIKVQVEHRRGLCVALYLPYKRKLLAGYKFGSVFGMPVSAEGGIWADDQNA